MRCKDPTDMAPTLMKRDPRYRYRIPGCQIRYGGAACYVFGLNGKLVFSEKPKKGEKPLNDAGEPVPADSRTGCHSDDIAGHFRFACGAASEGNRDYGDG